MSPIVNSWDVKEDPNIARIQDQIDWYDRKSGYNQKRYKGLKIAEIVAAALIPFLSALHFSDPSMLFLNTNVRFATVVGTVTALLGVLITILEGVLQLQKYQDNWVTYRTTCESLVHEKFTYIAGAGVYATGNTANPHALLVERAEITIGAQENSKWAALQQTNKDEKK